MKDRVLGATAVLVAAGMVVFGIGLQAPISYEPVGPRAFPLLIAALLGAVGVWLILRGGGERGGVVAAGEKPVAAAPATPILGSNVVIALIAVLAYAALFEKLGFIVATATMTIVIGKLFRGGWVACTLVGLGMGIGFFFFFDRLLDVTLPTGVLSSYL